MNTRTKVYLRADGSSQIGLGHIHRLLALSEILRQFFHCIFIIKSSLKGIRALILETCDEIIELDAASEEGELLQIKSLSVQPEIFVLDGYHFQTNYQKEIKKNNNAVVCIDDIHSYHFVSDIVINPAGGIDSTLYSKESNTEVFTGPQFALIKKPFLLSRNKPSPKEKTSVMICMGGADPNNHTLDAVNDCLENAFDSLYVVIGEAYMYKDLLVAAVKKSSKQIEVLSNLKADALANVMSQCSTAICSASGIAYEYLSVGGLLYIKQTAENQSHLYNYLLREGLAFKFDDFPVGKETVEAALKKQREIFDGQSPARILKIFHRLDFNLNISIRTARDLDVMTTFKWANDPELRMQSYSSDPIPLETHKSWFTRKINDPASVMYIFEYKGLPVAQVRFDIHSDEAIISYSLDVLYRGRGWGALVLQAAVQKFKAEHSRSLKISGFVKHQNSGSNKIFKKLGFNQHEAKEYPNSFKYELVES